MLYPRSPINQRRNFETLQTVSSCQHELGVDEAPAADGVGADPEQHLPRVRMLRTLNLASDDATCH